MKENIKIALLALISLTLIINTFMKGDNSEGPGNSKSNNSTVATPQSSNQSVVVPVEDNGLVSNEPLVDNKPKTTVVFDTYDYDFGDIDQETENVKLFAFTNTGSLPLLITNAKGSCGCTVPEYPKEPIQPGESGEIKVVYNPGKQTFKQTKSVTITANTDPETTVLKIYANVIPLEGAEQQPL